MMSSGAFSSPTIATIAGVRQLLVQTRMELCGVDPETGNVLWKEPIEAFRGMNILTPLVFGNRVFTSAHSGKAQLFEITRTAEDDWRVNELWSLKTQAYMSSPVLIGDSIYLHLKNQRFAALAVSDGSVRWTSSPYGKYWSMVTNGNSIVSLDSSGELFLIEASDQELKLVDQVKVADDSWAHLAVQDDLLIVRDLNALKVFRWR
jgi:outer membrane protein assembly factor BamB